MCASQFITQRQIMLKNMPGGGDNPMAQQQKILLYVFPIVFAVSGVYFPVGVLLYWLTTNLWTMGQQFYVIRKMPAPGSKAEEALHARKAAKAAPKGAPAGSTETAVSAASAGGTSTAAAEAADPDAAQDRRTAEEGGGERQDTDGEGSDRQPDHRQAASCRPTDHHRTAADEQGPVIERQTRRDHEGQLVPPQGQVLGRVRPERDHHAGRR